MKEIKRHLKKSITLIVALVMLVTMIPFISAPVYAETEITEVNLLFDEYDFTKFAIGQIESEANRQFIELVEIVTEDQDKYFFDTINSDIVYKDPESPGSWFCARYSEDPISADRDYYLEYVIEPKPGYAFPSDLKKMSFYINGEKITPYKKELGGPNNSLKFKVPVTPVPKYTPRPQRNVRVKLYGHDDIHVSWDAQIVEGAEMKYRVEYKRSTWSDYKVLNYGTTRNYRKKANLVNGARYKFRVTPYTVVEEEVYWAKPGYSPYIYTLKKIAAPRVSKSSRNYVRLRWTNIPGESGYQISRSRYKTKNFKTVKRVSYKYSTTRIKTPRNRTYYYKIRAYKTVDGKRIYAPWSAVRAYRLR